MALSIAVFHYIKGIAGLRICGKAETECYEKTRCGSEISNAFHMPILFYG